MPQRTSPRNVTQNGIEIHLLDVRDRPYGDCALCRLGDLSVLISGGHKGDQEPSDGHRSIPEQLGGILRQPHVYLLIVTHTHLGACRLRWIRIQLAADLCLLADTDLGWGATAETRDLVADPAIEPRVRRLMEALRDDSEPESPVPPTPDFLPDA